MSFLDEMIEAIESGAIDAQKLTTYLIVWMNEQEAQDFMRRNDLKGLAPVSFNLTDEIEDQEDDEVETAIQEWFDEAENLIDEP